MPRRGEARLQRLEAQLAPPFEVEARYWRRGLRWVVEACAMIQEAAVKAGIDPAGIDVLRLGEGAAAVLRGFADTPRIALADEEKGKADDADWAARHPDEPDQQEQVAEFERLGQCYVNGSAPGPSGSIDEWLAWALLRQEATIEEIQLPTPCPGDLKPADAGRP